MKKKRNKNVNKVLITRFVVSVVLCMIVAIVPTFYISAKYAIENNYTADRSDYQGVLEIWNIDTFEGGTSGKYSFLKSQAINFEKKNKGLYFMVKNMTEEQCLLNLQNGQVPAMFSFGVGVGEKILDYLCEIDQTNLDINDEFLAAGKYNDKLLAAAWCRGVYALITTTERLEKVSQNTNNLASIATNCGYVTQLKNKTKTTYSLAFGSAGYVCPQLAFSLGYKNLVQNSTSIDLDNLNKTPYTAYCDFIEGKASILLGTQRDIARVENRVACGKLENVVYQYLTEYTDLVQYLSIAKNSDAQITGACQAFINFITAEDAQKSLANIGMFSVRECKIYSSGIWQEIENLFESLIVENAFTSESKLNSNKQTCIDCEQI